MSIPNGYRIVKLTDIESELTDYHTHGARPGAYLGFEQMEKYYSMRAGGCTDWTGLPQSGKTELLLECLFNTSEFYGHKHLLCVPDIGDSIEVMSILIHKYTGQTFDKKYKNYIDIKTAFNACGWLFEHFHILEKKNPKAPIMTPVEFWEFAVEYKQEHGIHTATIDSWKDMRHDYSKYGGTYAMYLSQVLPIRNGLAEEHGIHFHTVIHPKQPRRNKGGTIVHPDVDDMEGGAQWNNSGKSILSVHRESFDTKIALVMVCKAKPRVVGRRGIFSLIFDPVKSRYTEVEANTGRTKYAEPKRIKALPAASIQTQLLPSDDFLITSPDEEDLPF